MTNKYKNSNNVYKTKALFYEWNTVSPEGCLYSLTEDDRFVDNVLYPSVYRLFIASGDPTGYKFASEYLGNWHHYQMLYKSPWFKQVIDKAISELEIKIRSEALVGILREGKDRQSKSQFQANKFLLEKGYLEKDSPVGRPTKAKITEEANKIVAELDDLEELHSRITMQ